jgi:hypothetical protein
MSQLLDLLLGSERRRICAVNDVLNGIAPPAFAQERAEVSAEEARREIELRFRQPSVEDTLWGRA